MTSDLAVDRSCCRLGLLATGATMFLMYLIRYMVPDLGSSRVKDCVKCSLYHCFFSLVIYRIIKFDSVL